MGLAWGCGDSDSLVVRARHRKPLGRDFNPTGTCLSGIFTWRVAPRAFVPGVTYAEHKHSLTASGVGMGGRVGVWVNVLVFGMA